MELTGIIVVSTGILVFALVSRKLDSTVLTLPIVFTTFGWLLSFGIETRSDMHVERELIHTIAEITLILVLFSDAARVNLRALSSNYKIPLRMLLIGMPITIGLGTLLAHWVSPEAHWALALLVAAILTPTDAALGQSVVTSPKVPETIRQSINVESGLNDGLALPVVMIAAILSAHATGIMVEEMDTSLTVFTLKQIALGPVAGIAVGFAGAKLIDLAINEKLAQTTLLGVAFLAIAILSFTVAEAMGGNGFIAAFIGGLVFGNTLKDQGIYIYEFLESEGQLFTIITFIIFGALLLPQGIEHASWRTVVLAILYLSVIRMLPIWISLTGSGLSAGRKLFLGWFGPRGLASILFAILILEKYPVPGGEEILSCVVLTVLLSVFLHGLSAKPLTALLFKSD